MMKRVLLLTAAALIGASSVAYASCLVVGDSINTVPGIGGGLPGCTQRAVKGLGSARIIGQVTPGFDVVVASVGSNDRDPIQLGINLRTMRARAPQSCFVWVVPQSGVMAARVEAQKNAVYGDVAFQPRPVSRDGVHPMYGPARAQALYWLRQCSGLGQ